MFLNNFNFFGRMNFWLHFVISFSITEHLLKFNTQENLFRTSNSYMIKIASIFCK